MKCCRNDVNNQIKLARQSYYKKSFNLLVSRQPDITWEKHEDLTITASEGLAEAFNDYFVAVGPKLPEEIQSAIYNRSPLHYLMVICMNLIVHLKTIDNSTAII